MGRSWVLAGHAENMTQPASNLCAPLHVHPVNFFFFFRQLPSLVRHKPSKWQVSQPRDGTATDVGNQFCFAPLTACHFLKAWREFEAPIGPWESLRFNSTTCKRPPLRNTVWLALDRA